MHDNGRKRFGETFEAMKTSHDQIKRAASFCKSNENMLKNEISHNKFI